MKSKLQIFLLFIILIAVFWQWWLPGPRVANDFPIVSQAQLKSGLDFPGVWTEGGAEGLGEYAAFFLWSYPLKLISGALSSLGFSFAILERIILVLPLLGLGFFGIWNVCQTFKLSSSAKLIASLIYLTNTYIILLIDGGQLSIGLSYAFFPLSFLAVVRSVMSGLGAKILAGMSVAILGFFDFRLIFVLFLLLFLRFSFEFLYLERKKWGDWIREWTLAGMVCGLVLIGLNAYWLLPLKFAPILASTHAFFTQTAFINSPNLGHAITLLSPHWYKNIFGSVTELKWEFLAVPILVFIAPLLRKRNPVVGFWLLTALFSIFLTKGASEPLSQVYPWLFQNIPGFSLFRDSTKFFFLVALSYSILIGITVDEIISRIKKFSIFNFQFSKLFLLFTIFCLLFLIRPVFTDSMTGTFSTQIHQKEFSELGHILENDDVFGRIFWIPSFPVLGYAAPTHPRVEAARLVQKRTFSQGTKGTYEIFNFLREAPYMGQIFDVAGIGYIAYPYLDPKKDNLHPDNIKYYYTFSNQLSNLPWLAKVDSSPVPLWKTINHQEKFFITPNVWWVIGSDSIYNEATKSAHLKLSNNALIFAEETPGLGQSIDQLPEAKIVLNNKTPIDLAASFIDRRNLIFPARQLKFDPDESGWWKREAVDLIRWRSFLQSKYGIDNQDFDLGGGWAVGEGSLKLKVKSEKLKIGDILLVKVMESSRSGSLTFYQDDIKIGKVETRINEDANIRWFEVGLLADDGSITVSSEGDINVVNALAIFDKNEWDNFKDKANNLQGRVIDFNEKNAQDDNPAVTYRKINPTKYIVNVNGLTKASFLVFSQNYDGLWKMDGQTSLPVYSLLNGFKIEKDGQYKVEFEPQRYVYPGLAITGVTALIMLLIIFKNMGSKPS